MFLKSMFFTGVHVRYSRYKVHFGNGTCAANMEVPDRAQTLLEPVFPVEHVSVVRWLSKPVQSEEKVTF